MTTQTSEIRWQEIPLSPAAGDPLWAEMRRDDIGAALAEDAGAVYIRVERLDPATGYLESPAAAAFYFPASGAMAAESGGDWSWYYGLAGRDILAGDERDQLIGAALELYMAEGWTEENDQA